MAYCLAVASSSLSPFASTSKDDTSARARFRSSAGETMPSSASPAPAAVMAPPAS